METVLKQFVIVLKRAPNFLALREDKSLIIDHIGLVVSNYERSKEFYLEALAPLGITLMMEVEGWAGYSRGSEPEFCFKQGITPQHPMHIAFAAQSREQVRAFYDAALAAGGKGNGRPGIREIYHPNYYAAFVIDPDGHNIEAVCHKAGGLTNYCNETASP